MEHLYLISGILVFFAGTLLIGKPRKQRHDGWLIAWLSVILLHLVGFYVEQRQPFHFLLELSSAAVLLQGVLLWFYTKALTERDFNLSFRQSWHFLPFLLHLALVLPSVWQGSLAPLSDTLRGGLTLLKLISVGGYMCLILVQLRKLKQNEQEYFSYPVHLQLNWLKVVAICILAIVLLGGVSQFLFHTGQLSWLTEREDLVVNGVAAVLVIGITYFGFRQTLIFTNHPEPRPSFEKGSQDSGAPVVENPESLLQGKYQKSGLQAEASEAYWRQLQAHMQAQKPFLNPELTLAQLAAEMGVSPNQLSQVINEQARQNFADFVNGYRVQEVKERLTRGDHERFTLLALALEAGFNSKASFNRAFKKFTGQTPSEYGKTPLEPAGK
ncbi:helix-turn-helix domain-containing protein [Sabulibacter ruber]|uniref:helix-turn-helix domain-containing protein n=1 Tax=Sabulibacter ruber TaxID=2811901 RepID=UPI001A972C87